MSDSTNEYVTRPVRLRETGTAFHIKSGRSHFHLCHTFIISCQEIFFPPTPSSTPSVSKQHLWHLLDFMYISLSQLSGEELGIMAGREMSDLWWALWFIIRCSSAKCTKGVSLFYFFLLSPGFGNDDVWPILFPSSDLKLAQETTFNIVFRVLSFFFWCYRLKKMCFAAAGVVFFGLQKTWWQAVENVTGSVCFTAPFQRGLNCKLHTLWHKKSLLWHIWIQRRSNAAGVFNLFI